MKMKKEKASLSDYVYSLQSRGHYWFDRTKAIQSTGLSPASFAVAASRLVKKKMIQRVRGDFFIIIPVQYVLVGTLPATWFMDPFMGSLDLPYYVSLLSAAGIHGASHQQVMVFQVMTNKIMRPIKMGNLKINFYFRKVINPDCYLPVKTETGQINVATPEMTLCDCFRYQEAAGHLNNIATLLLEIHEKIHMKKLMTYIRSGFLELTHIQRLGYLIEQLQIPLDTQDFYRFAQERNMQNCLLVSGLPSSENYNEKWKIIINETVEPDDL